ncbi:BspA family leucine-rich repeat surface protein [Flagellimonas pacifica]|uniref:VCBS repeat-containing protein/surface protein n=1 Tax=Flagellimonas pacifica TaxID=1247520 RepID=A0A285MWG9_9FLAO|nr:BspA family leucine-rich repeat surface protein [Allomuricauda parva]SNY99821.1 VCBS repeat-containing protein/surface protein [Allomuricauda parva]
MKTTKLLLMMVVLFVVALSCGKDDGPENNAPAIKAQTFPAKEDIASGTVIGTVKASDEDGDALTYSITKNDADLFAIDKDGKLSLATAKNLDFETKTTHAITVAVSDGDANASATITINVTDVDDDPEEGNNAPTIEPQSFSVEENIAHTDSFATVSAEDADADDTLTFSITDESGLFVITGSGEISLNEENELDFEALEDPAIKITVKVTDGKDETQAEVTINVTNVNERPVVDQESYEFEAKEDIDADNVIGEITVTDPDAGDTLTFSIADGDENNLFEINTDGELSLADGKNLDFENATSHTLTVSVSDAAELQADKNITITINVTNVIETLLEDPTSFITTWKSDNPGESTDTQITIPTTGGGYNYTVYWEEVGNPGHNGTENNVDGNITIEFGTAGTYQVAISGAFPRIYFEGNDEANNNKILTVDRWGSNQWSSMNRAFSGCSNLTVPAMDVPDLSNVTEMHRMFQSATSFNKDISGWDVSNVIFMTGMFDEAKSFNQNISNWDVSNVEDMSNMFHGAISFNQPLSWGNKTSNVTNMLGMFEGATAFDQDIDDWDVKNVTTMLRMFYGATSFNKYIGSWNVLGVENMHWMFRNATSFNKDISSWDVSSVETMQGMFQDATAFDQDLGDWNVSSVGSMINMLSNSGLSPENYGATLVGWASLGEDENPLTNVPQDITLGANGLEYCVPEGEGDNNEVYLARAILSDEGWNIQGDINICGED